MKRHAACILGRALICASIAGVALLSPSDAAAVTVSACTDSGMCGAGTGACSISSTIDVVPGSVLDCSGRDLTVTGGGTLKVTGGSMLLRARDLTVLGPGGTITGIEGSDESPATVVVELTGTLGLSGKIRVNGQHGGGTIEIRAAGNISIAENGTDGLEADGTGSGADGGTIIVTAGGTLSVYDPIHAAGAGGPGSDSSGGTIELEAQGNILTAMDGHISAEGLAGGGGTVRIISHGGDVSIDEHVDVEGRSTTGNGGEIDISAFDSLLLAEQITARGGVNTSGGEAYGGSVSLRSGCGGMSIAGNILVNGGQIGDDNQSGSIDLGSRGAVTVGASVTLDARALASAGQGGTIDITSGQALLVSGSALLDARGGTTSPGKGGAIRLNGCTTEIAASAVVDVTANTGGSIVVGGRKAPPAEGDQPLSVATGAQVKAAGADSTKTGVISLAPAALQIGGCTNIERGCFLDSDCTEGCDTGECLNASPDTDGIGTQFDIVPEKIEDSGAALCDATCVP